VPLESDGHAIEEVLALRRDGGDIAERAPRSAVLDASSHVRDERTDSVAYERSGRPARHVIDVCDGEYDGDRRQFGKSSGDVVEEGSPIAPVDDLRT
jgi:hypothetical protein